MKFFKISKYRHVFNPSTVFLFLAVLSLSASPSAKGQAVGGTLTGAVNDQSGAAIANASVAIKNVDTGIVNTATTNGDGLYSEPNLVPGSYEVTASAPGFGPVQTTLTLTVGAPQTLNLVLKVGASTQSVVITDTPPIMNLTDATLGGLNDEHTIKELPLNGRSWTDLAILQPGVVLLTEVPSVSDRARYGRGYGTELSISGSRPQQNNYRLDGISINDPSNGGPGSVLGGNIGVDAISEFSVLTSNYSAAYGRASGGVINATTKSGTNSFHGTVYEFLRNSALDAANYFDIKKPPFKRNQFGASAGGPIKKDKTFIFADYEGLRQNLSLTQNSFVPSANARIGILSTGNVVVDPQAARFLAAFFPLPNTPTTGDVGSFIFGRPQVTNENFFTVRLDQALWKDSFHAVYVFDNADTTVPDEFNNKKTDTLSHRQILSLDDNHIFTSKLVNDIRAGVVRYFIGGPASASAINPATKDITLGSVPGESAPAIIINGITGFSGGLSAAAPQRDPWTDYQVSDDAFYTKGIHSLTFGANLEKIQWNRLQEVRPGGQWNFGSLASFLTNNPVGFQADATGTITDRHIRQTIVGVYLQDDMKVRSNLTVNVGLRYEPATVMSETEGKVVSLLQPTDQFPHIGNPMYQNNTLHDFDPRIGFAWDPFKDGKTSVRGGFGLYDQLPTPQYFSNPVSSSPPFYLSVNVTPGPNPAVNLQQGDFPTNAYQKGAVLLAAGSTVGERVAFVQQNPKRAYVEQYNFSIQRQLAPSLSVLVGYVGSHGVHGITETDDGNVVLPISSPLGYLWPCEPFSPTTGCGGIGSGKRLNPFIGREPYTLWRNSSVYNGLQAQVTKRMSHGFQIQGSFTWQKILDTASGGNAADQFLNGISSVFAFDPKVLRGPADFNIPKVLSINYLWSIPSPKADNRLANKILGGWQLGGIFTAENGTPFTPLLAGDPLGLDSTDAFAYPDRVRGPGCGSGVNPGNIQNYIKVQCFAVTPAVVFNGVNYIRLGNAGRNELIGPGLVNLDFSLFKNITLTEAIRLQFRVEAFNVLNHPNFAAPVDNGQHFILDPTIAGIGIVPSNPLTDVISRGALDSTSTTSRQLQFALKVIW